MEDSLHFYTDVLGFAPRYLHNDPVDYAVLKLKDISVHLSKGNSVRPEPNTRMYFFVHDVDAVFDDIQSRYVGNVSEPTTWDYGMRDFDVVDPDGHRLSFGKNVAKN